MIVQGYMIYFKRGLATVVLALAGLGAIAVPTSYATDNVPCHSPAKRDLTDPDTGRVWPGTEVKFCNLTQGHVPVYASRSASAPVVGYLEQGGAANWFVTEMKGGDFRLGSAANNWWGSTKADNGRWGWVPEVYFAGGDNYEDDAGLLMPGNYTCANTCPRLPFWAR
ncbi:hypothetical protein ACFWXK_21305 [Streptomyces sp. NPDC059070]|uniref:hypothetical protein n=1 Tax=Streptomyces sp. NPDC059070 TaxID=3346713 RepID=UPI0036A0AAC6